jgi:predicted enzyme related to lactoylglutathione lyase
MLRLNNLTRGTTLPNPVVFFEIGCQDSGSTCEFYASLFDWKLTANPGATAVDTGEGIGGHIVSLGHEPHQYALFYVQVDDVAEAVEKAKILGGKAIVGPIPIPTGTFAWISDPGGNTIGLWKPN